MKRLLFAVVLCPALAFSAGTAKKQSKAPPLPPERQPATYVNQAKEMLKAYKNKMGDPSAEAVAVCEYLEKTIADAPKIGLSDDAVAQLWMAYTGHAWSLFRDDLFQKGFDNVLRIDPGYTNREQMAARYLPHARALAEAKTFPRAEKDIRFGQTLASMGVADTNVVHLKDYWDPKDVTAAFQKLVDDPSVTTIVLDRMPTPWFVDSVKFNSKVRGKRVLFKSGVTVLRRPDRYVDVVGKKSAAMFCICGAKNLIIESDAEKPEDVYIGFYPNHEERVKHCKREGASGFTVGSAEKGRTDTSRNIVLRNFRVAETEQDGLAIGGLWTPPEEIYVENVILDSNYRQGTSPCAYYSLYFKNCKFVNTRGGPPTAGVDVEPYDDFLCTANLYFFDCEFANNGGGGLLFATSTRDPILCYVKRCTFRPTPGAQFCIVARPSRYIAADGKPVSNIILEDCSFDTTGPTLSFNPSPIYNVTLRNSVIRDARHAQARKSAKRGPAPVSLTLNRDFGSSEMTDNIRPRIAFENVRIEGFENSDPLAISDELGKLSIRRVFSGTVDWNGKPFDFSKVEYAAPDVDEPRTAFVDLKTLLRPAKVPAPDEAMPESNAELCFSGAWWLKAPNHSYYFWAEKGREVSFDLTVRYPRYYKTFPTNAVHMTLPSGAEAKIADVTAGTASLKYTATETGWHRFTPGLTLDTSALSSGISWFVTNVKGAHFAWQADTQSDSFAKFFLKDKSKDYVGYFEVPAGGKPCRLRASFGGFELYNPAGDLVDKVAKDDYRGRYVFEIRPSSDKAEIWSFRTPCTKEGGSTRALRFYAPLNGLWADTPEDLPCVFAEHFVPAKKAAVARAAVAFTKLDRSLLTSEQCAKLDAAIAARKAFAAKRDFAAMLAREEAKIEKMREGTMNDDTQHQIDDLTGHVEVLRRAAKMEELAAAETPEVAETAAFCQAFAGDLVKEQELDWPKGQVEYEQPSDLMPLRSLILKRLAVDFGR